MNPHGPHIGHSLNQVWYLFHNIIPRWSVRLTVLLVTNLPSASTKRENPIATIACYLPYSINGHLSVCLSVPQRLLTQPEKKRYMANFLLKCRNCRCHGNKALSEPTKTLPWNQKLRLYLLYNRSCGQFTVKISKFSLPWERGSSDKSSTDTIKLADPDACKYPGRISCTSSVIVDFVLKIANFR